jgi:predicted GNAT family N-acyltransferase
MSAHIRIAKSSEELSRIFRLRYDVYVREMKHCSRYANDAECTITDPLDVHAVIFVAVDGERVVGSLRLNLGVDGDFGEYTALYQMHEFGPYFPRSMSITTKLIVAKEYRTSTLPLQLAMEAFKTARDAGVCFDLIDCQPHLRGFFRKLGYRQVMPHIDHPDDGKHIPLVIALQDAAHFSRVRSPFRKLVQDNLTNPSVLFFEERFATALSTKSFEVL